MEQLRETSVLNYPKLPDRSKRTKGQERANRNGLLGTLNQKTKSYVPKKKVNICYYQPPPQIERRVIGEPYRVDDTVCVWDGERFLPIRNEIVGVSRETKCGCEPDALDYPILPRKPAQRVSGTCYLNAKNEKVIWNGTRLNCEHNKQKCLCKICKSNTIQVENEHSIQLESNASVNERPIPELESNTSVNEGPIPELESNTSVNEGPIPAPVQSRLYFQLENVHGNCSVSYTYTSGGEKSCVTFHLENVQGNDSCSFNIPSNPR